MGKRKNDTRLASSKEANTASEQEKGGNGWSRTANVQWGCFLVLAGCCLNNVSLEFIVKEDRNAASLITFCQFLFIAFEGLIVHMEFGEGDSQQENHNNYLNQYNNHIPRKNGTKKGGKRGKKGRQGSKEEDSWVWGIVRWLGAQWDYYCPLRLKPRRIPLWNYLIMVTIFFLISVINNAALGYNIALPFHMIFRSGSLITTAVLGRVLFKHHYSVGQYIAAFTVTLGIIMATLAAMNVESATSPSGDPLDLITWFIGLTMLFSALVMSSVLGLYQEHVYNKYKGNAKEKPYRETMFYSHLLALPFFLILLPDMIERVEFWKTLTPITIPWLEVSFPVIWFHLICNVITQWICIRGVFMLTGNLSSLSTTLVISIRKFVSLLISVYYFSNPFTSYHWFGTICVFGGTFLYTMAQPQKPKTTPTQPPSSTTTTTTPASNGGDAKKVTKQQKAKGHNPSRSHSEKTEQKQLKGVLRNSLDGSSKQVRKIRKSVSFSE